MMNQRNNVPKDETPDLAFDPVEAALRQMFDNVAAEDVPEDFAALVAKLQKRPSPSQDS
jgi:hypothetical protein